ncbi:MAG: hypothetical protein M1839_001365 [Geoglossum umbratile]|nr:MAG: hypothetical protein M1839_001365 [Geoglossum umbratile]
MNTPPPEDPYKVLGVPKDATKDAIRSAHRKLVLQSHPDKVQDESLRAQKQDEFQRVQQAYEVLIDEARRQQYDETVKRDELKRQLAEERAKSSRRYETIRTSPREFDDRRSHTRAYEDGRPRSFDDGHPSRYDAFGARHPSRSFEGRKSSSRAEEDERAQPERERKRESERSERRRARDRERDRERGRGRDDKYSRTYYGEEEDLHHIPIPRESSKIHVEPDRLATPVFEEKYNFAQDYIRRTSEDIPPRHLAGGRVHKAYYPVPVPPQPPTPPPITVEEPPIRRSAARPRERERKREPGRPTSRGKDNRIVDPPRYHESKGKIVPPLTTSVSSPPNIDIPPLSGRSHHSHSRSSPGMAPLKSQRTATVETVRPRMDGMPTFTRAHTSPMVSTPRKENVSGKLKEKVTKTPLGEAGFDSGYSSSTPESPYLGGGRSPPSRYMHRASPKASSFVGVPMCEEPDEYITAQPRSRTIPRETDDLYERRPRSRSVSPNGRHVPETSSRPRGQPSTPDYRSPYVYTVEPSRVSPVSPHIPVNTPPRRAFTSDNISYTPRYAKEDILYAPYTPGRRATGPHGQPHYPRPYAHRVETSH